MEKANMENTIMGTNVSKAKNEIIDSAFGVWLDNLTYPSEARKRLDELLLELMEKFEIPETKKLKPRQSLNTSGLITRKRDFGLVS